MQGTIIGVFASLEDDKPSPPRPSTSARPTPTRRYLRGTCCPSRATPGGTHPTLASAGNWPAVRYRCGKQPTRSVKKPCLSRHDVLRSVIQRPLSLPPLQHRLRPPTLRLRGTSPTPRSRQCTRPFGDSDDVKKLASALVRRVQSRLGFVLAGYCFIVAHSAASIAELPLYASTAATTTTPSPAAAHSAAVGLLFPVYTLATGVSSSQS